MLNFVFGALLGYIIHDAVEPTVVGETLDKIKLPANLFVDPAEETSNAEGSM